MRRQLDHTLAGVDVFHSSGVVQWSRPGTLGVITLHDLAALIYPELHSPDERALQARAREFAQERADRVIAVSQNTKRDVAAHLGVPEHRVVVVYSGVGDEFVPVDDDRVVACALAPYGLTPHRYILHVGTLEPRKNLVRLIEAYRQARRQVEPPAPKLVLAGARGWRSEEVLGAVTAKGLTGEVLWLGRVPHDAMPSLYSGAALVVFPSLYEGFGLPPLEAMACGTPVVASHAPAIPEIVGDAAVLVDPLDTASIAHGMVSLLGDPDRQAALRATGIERARGFTWMRAAEETLAVYRDAQP
jgi:glycosyltransferase involved in cell wall biosynthesis